ncbi:ORFZ protein, partial [mine drainage metagenome]
MAYITVRPPVIPHRVALATEDPVLYMELAALLKEGGLPAVSVRPGDEVPRTVGVVITSPDEAGAIEHPHVVVVRTDTDRRALVAAIVDDLDPDHGPDRILVGIDPGPRPGYAVVSGRGCLARGSLDSPESAGGLVVGLRGEFPGRPIVYRVGTGDPVARNRVINGLLAVGATVELSREEG